MVIFQLRAEGFRHIDALDASEAMMNVAMENNLYEKYFCEFIGAKPLPIETGKIYTGLIHQNKQRFCYIWKYTCYFLTTLYQ